MPNSLYRLENKIKFSHTEDNGVNPPIIFTHVSLSKQSNQNKLELVNYTGLSVDIGTRIDVPNHYESTADAYSDVISVNVNDPIISDIVRKLVASRVLRWTGNTSQYWIENQDGLHSTYAVNLNHLKQEQMPALQLA